MDVNMNGWDENWRDTDDFKIVAIYARHAVEFGCIWYAIKSIGSQSQKANPEGGGSQGAR